MHPYHCILYADITNTPREMRMFSLFLVSNISCPYGHTLFGSPPHRKSVPLFLSDDIHILSELMVEWLFDVYVITGHSTFSLIPILASILNYYIPVMPIVG